MLLYQLIAILLTPNVIGRDAFMRVVRFCLIVLFIHPALSAYSQNGNFVPGSGKQLGQVGDDFEDPDWVYHYNNPKSTEENNEKQNQPLGKSANGRWFEVQRGQLTWCSESDAARWHSWKHRSPLAAVVADWYSQTT